MVGADFEEWPGLSRVIVCSAPVYEHYRHLRVIAADLISRGHAVTLLTGPRFRDSSVAMGAEFAPLTGAAADNPADALAAPERLAAPAGLPRLEWDLRHLVIDTMAAQYRDLRRLLAADGEPALVIAGSGFYGMVPLRLGAPGRRPLGCIGVGTAPFVLTSADTAPVGLELPPARCDADRTRHRMLYRQLHEEVLGGMQRYFNEVLAELGASAPCPPFFLDAPILTADRFLQLSIEELSYRRGDTPAHVGFVGTVAGARAVKNRRPAWLAEVDAAERVVVVTLRPPANPGSGDLIEPTLEALCRLPVLVVAVTGRTGRVHNVPANARIVESAPFDDLLPLADVVVTDGGHHAVQEALRRGIPLVLAGRVDDELEVNLRTAATGAAIRLASDRRTVSDLRKAVETVLYTADYRANAQRLAVEYARLDALGAISHAVDELGPSA